MSPWKFGDVVIGMGWRGPRGHRWMIVCRDPVRCVWHVLALVNDPYMTYFSDQVMADEWGTCEP